MKNYSMAANLGLGTSVGFSAEKNTTDQHQNTTYAGLAAGVACFGTGLCCFSQQGYLSCHSGCRHEV